MRHQADILRELGRPVDAEPIAAEGLAVYRILSGPLLDLANMLRIGALLKKILAIATELGACAEKPGADQASHVQAGVNEARRQRVALT